MTLAICMLIGGIAGWLAGAMGKGAGYGVIADIGVGVIGGLIGGWFFGEIGIAAGGLFGSIVAAIIGAAILIAAVQAARRNGLFYQLNQHRGVCLRTVEVDQPRPYLAWKWGRTRLPIISMTLRIFSDSMPGQPIRKIR